MSYKTERGNVAKKSLRFHAPVKMISDYQSVMKYPVAASRQPAPEVSMVMFMSPLDAPRRGFSATWSLMMVISMICDSPCAIKRFLRTSWWKMNSACVKNVLMLTPARELHSKSPSGDGGGSRHWLPKRGPTLVGRTGGILRPHPWLLLSRAQFLDKSVSCELTN